MALEWAEREEECFNCKGIGAVFTRDQPCPDCSGQGWTRGAFGGIKTCRDCDGEGRRSIHDGKCPDCNGTGKCKEVYSYDPEERQREEDELNERWGVGYRTD